MLSETLTVKSPIFPFSERCFEFSFQRAFFFKVDIARNIAFSSVKTGRMPPLRIRQKIHFLINFACRFCVNIAFKYMHRLVRHPCRKLYRVKIRLIKVQILGADKSLYHARAIGVFVIFKVFVAYSRKFIAVVHFWNFALVRYQIIVKRVHRAMAKATAVCKNVQTFPVFVTPIFKLFWALKIQRKIRLLNLQISAVCKIAPRKIYFLNFWLVFYNRVNKFIISAHLIPNWKFQFQHHRI